MTLTYRWRTTAAALIAGLGLAACTAQPDEPIEIGSAATPITPTTTPTLNERDQAVEDAKRSFLGYIKALDEMGHSSGAQEAVERARSWAAPGSSIDKDVQNTGRAYREQRAKGTGWSRVPWIEPRKVDTDQSDIMMRVCIDSTGLSGSVNGNSPEPAFLPYVEWTVHLTRPGDKWLIKDISDTERVKKC